MHALEALELRGDGGKRVRSDVVHRRVADPVQEPDQWDFQHAGELRQSLDARFRAVVLPSLDRRRLDPTRRASSETERPTASRAREMRPPSVSLSPWRRLIV